MKKLFFCCYFRFSLEFLQKSHVRTGLDSSLWTGSRQPVRPCACQLSVWFSMGLRARCRMGHLINMLDDDITTYFYHLKKLQLITWMLFLCSMRKGWGFKRLEELSGRKQKLASLLKMINDLRKIKRIGKSQSWVSSLMILKEDNFGISYRNLSHSHRPYLFIYLFFEGVLSHRQSANEIVNIFLVKLSKKKTARQREETSKNELCFYQTLFLCFSGKVEFLVS